MNHQIENKKDETCRSGCCCLLSAVSGVGRLFGNLFSGDSKKVCYSLMFIMPAFFFTALVFVASWDGISVSGLNDVPQVLFEKLATYSPQAVRVEGVLGYGYLVGIFLTLLYFPRWVFGQYHPIWFGSNKK